MFLCFKCCRQQESIADVGIRNQVKLRGTLQQSWSGNQRSDKVERYFEADELCFESCGQQESRVEPRITSRVIYVSLQAVRCVICGENPQKCSLFYGIWMPIVNRNDCLKTHTQRIKS